MSQPNYPNKLCRILNKGYNVIKENSDILPDSRGVTIIYGLPSRLCLTKEESDKIANELEIKTIMAAAGLDEFSELEKLFLGLLGSTW